MENGHKNRGKWIVKFIQNEDVSDKKKAKTILKLAFLK